MCFVALLFTVFCAIMSQVRCVVYDVVVCGQDVAFYQDVAKGAAIVVTRKQPGNDDHVMHLVSLFLFDSLIEKQMWSLHKTLIKHTYLPVVSSRVAIYCNVKSNLDNVSHADVFLHTEYLWVIIVAIMQQRLYLFSADKLFSLRTVTYSMIIDITFEIVWYEYLRNVSTLHLNLMHILCMLAV